MAFQDLMILNIMPVILSLLTHSYNLTGMDGEIDDHQVLKYQPSVTSRLILQYLMIMNGDEISL